MQNALETNHIAAARRNTALTEVFKTPEGVNVQVIACVKVIDGVEYPEFYLNRISPT
jgi:hypothetical protein